MVAKKLSDIIGSKERDDDTGMMMAIVARKSSPEAFHSIVS